MQSQRLSFAKKNLLQRSADAVFVAYEMLEEYDEKSIRDFLVGDIIVAAVAVVSGLEESNIVDEVVKQARKKQLQTASV